LTIFDTVVYNAHTFNFTKGAAKMIQVQTNPFLIALPSRTVRQHLISAVATQRSAASFAGGFVTV